MEGLDFRDWMISHTKRTGNNPIFQGIAVWDIVMQHAFLTCRQACQFNPGREIQLCLICIFFIRSASDTIADNRLYFLYPVTNF